MTDKEMFMIDCLNHGASATITQASGGTTCPCTAERGSYSAEWHANNPTAEDCNGTGKIGTTAVTTSVKAFFTHELQTLATMLGMELMSEIGEIQSRDMLMYGTVKVEDGSFFDLSDLNEARDSINYDSKTFVRRHVYDLATDAVVGQVALLKRTA